MKSEIRPYSVSMQCWKAEFPLRSMACGRDSSWYSWPLGLESSEEMNTHPWYQLETFGDSKMEEDPDAKAMTGCSSKIWKMVFRSWKINLGCYWSRTKSSDDLMFMKPSVEGRETTGLHFLGVGEISLISHHNRKYPDTRNKGRV